ncbi:MAG: hypothetical protein HYR89_06190, partial [Actinobacteria bacterium]|nr:hypothetical protein [Actinomycetota bacterium]
MKKKQGLGIAGAAGLAVLLAATPAGAAVTSITAVGPLRDLSPAADPTDGARAVVRSLATSAGTTVRLSLRGLDPAFAGVEYGAHVHVGPCVAGDGVAAGSHYNSTGVPGTEGRIVSDQTEVWLDFVIDGKGRASSKAKVPFVIPKGGA